MDTTLTAEEEITTMDTAALRKILAHHEAEVEAVRVLTKLETRTVAQRAFDDQSAFLWATLAPGTSQRAEMASFRQRPEVQGVSAMIPPEGHLAIADADATFEEQEAAISERHSALVALRHSVAQERFAGQFDMEEILFGDLSSEDSEEFNEDFEEEWRDLTSQIYAACRKVQCQEPDGGEAFSKMTADVGHLALTPTEVETIWDTLRMLYRRTDPLHPKHWLESCHRIDETGNFLDRPSITEFVYVMHAALRVQSMRERQKKKITRWSERGMALLRKRIVALREFGVQEPTWRHIHVSVGGHDRDEKVPLLVLTQAMGGRPDLD
jgi:hypothetical protein